MSEFEQLSPLMDDALQHIERENRSTPNGWPPWPEEMVVQLRELVASGYTQTEIGEKLGVSNQSVHRKCQRMGLKSVGRRCRDPELGIQAGDEVATQRAKGGDLRFKRAMLRAIKAGLEHAPLGVVKS